MTSTRMDGPPHRRQGLRTQDRLEPIHLQPPIESLLHELTGPPGHREIRLRVQEGLFDLPQEFVLRSRNVPVDSGTEPGYRPGRELEHDKRCSDGHAVHDLHERADSPSDRNDAQGGGAEAGVDVRDEAQPADQGMERGFGDVPSGDVDLATDSSALQMRREALVHELECLPIRVVPKTSEEQQDGRAFLAGGGRVGKGAGIDVLEIDANWDG